ncbi:MAG: hypothetical protein HYZ53_06675 [Planctomycetes bacterium]|nr:hypothetical protein [Planctomycetota bacterium]
MSARALLAVGLLLSLSHLSTPALADAEDFLRVEDTRPGMTGYGLTVFKGTEIERFDVKVLAVLKRVMPCRDLVLIECGAKILEKSSIIAGMSGSPIYIEGKLAGALSRGFTFPKDAIAMYTPIADMVEEGNHPLEYGRYWRADDASGIVPCRTPLFVSGLGPRAQEFLADRLKPFGLVPVAGGAGDAAAGGPEIPLVAGSAVGFQLCKGDLTMTGVGTVTYRDGDRVFAFGHPFLQGGELSMPMTTAVVHTVVASSMMSFKMASPAQEVGSLVQDRASTVMGVIGKICPMLPVEVTLENLKTKTVQKVRIEVIRNPVYTPMLIQLAVMNAIETLEPGSNDVTVEVKARMELDKYPALEVSETASSTSGLSGDPSGIASVLMPAVQLMMNPFQKVQVKSLSVWIGLRPERRTAEITRAWSEQAQVEAGKEARVCVALRPYNGSEALKTLSVPIPRDVPSGSRLLVHLHGGQAARTLLPQPTNVDELLAFLKDRHSSTNLVATLVLPSASVRYRGFDTRRIPIGLLRELVPLLDHRARVAPDLDRVFLPTEWVVEGTYGVTLRVK